MCSRPVLDQIGLTSAALCRTKRDIAPASLEWINPVKKHMTCRLCQRNLVWLHLLEPTVIILSWSVFFSVYRRARTTTHRRKHVTPSRHPTSSTIIFIIIKRTNAETNTIILLWQKKRNQRKKYSHWKSSSFLQDKSFMTIYCKCHVINVMCWM